jgi:sterol desaturase/sphingolipid hydroxylase (fatty acid hydroxylase superfamily)
MLLIALLYSRGRPRDTPAASWRDLRSPHGLYLADLLSNCIVLSSRWEPLPAFAPRHLASFFLFRLLLMELVFDFFHYCSHRLSHTLPVLYTHFHKIHHSHHADLHVGSTLQMHPVDGMLTNTLPLLLAVALIPLQSHWEFHVYMAYKTAQELFGHCGAHVKVRPPLAHSPLGGPADTSGLS